jgi:crotonobetainyl-CoA:carnitine CoA-transferase CaiB-like acyl-CoA transferase
MRMDACAGLRVLDLASGIAGPLAGRVLADLGAEVVAVSPPGGHRPDRHGVALSWQFGKHRRTLDLNTAADRARLRDLAASADVLIESFRPGRMERWGLGYGALARANTGLVYCAITGWGPDGPLAEAPADEGLVQAYSGLAGRQGGYRPGPVPVAVPVASVLAGLLAAIGILGALVARARGVGGQRVDTSLLAGALAAQRLTLQGTDTTPPERPTPLASARTPVVRAYECADGRWIQIACNHSDFFQKLLIALDRAEFLLDPRWRNVSFGAKGETDEAALIDFLAKRFREAPTSDWLPLLEANDVPHAPVLSAADFWQDPRARQQELFVEEHDLDLGRVRRLGPLFRIRPFEGGHPGPSHRRTTGDLSATPTRPLAGMRVIECSVMVAAPYGGQILGQLGAEVVKLEPIPGDFYRKNPNFFLAFNAGKRSVRADLKTAEGREVALRLLEGADVFLHNWRSGVAERLRLDPETLRRELPHLIYAQVSTFGSDGPYARRPGFDGLAQALTGIAETQGGRHNPPTPLNTPLCDIAASFAATAATLAAILRRERTGEGALVDSALIRAGAAFTAHRSVAFLDRSSAPEETPASGDAAVPVVTGLDAGQWGFGPCYRIYPTADGWIFVSAQEGDWSRLCASLETEDASEAAAEGALAAMTNAQAIQRLSEAGIPVQPVRLGFNAAFPDDAQVKSQGLAWVAMHPVYGRYRCVGSEIRLSGAPLEAPPFAPALGADTTALLADLGFRPDQIQNLADRQVIGLAEPWPAAQD